MQQKLKGLKEGGWEPSKKDVRTEGFGAKADIIRDMPELSSVDNFQMWTRKEAVKILNILRTSFMDGFFRGKNAKEGRSKLL